MNPDQSLTNVVSDTVSAMIHLFNGAPCDAIARAVYGTEADVDYIEDKAESMRASPLRWLSTLDSVRTARFTDLVILVGQGRSPREACRMLTDGAE